MISDCWTKAFWYSVEASVIHNKLRHVQKDAMRWGVGGEGKKLQMNGAEAELLLVDQSQQRGS